MKLYGSPTVVSPLVLPSRPIAYYGYGEMGLATGAVQVDIARLPAGRGGPISATTRSTKGVRMKISSLDAPRSQHHAAGVEDHRQLRQLNAGQEWRRSGRLRRSHHVEQSAGLVSECSW